MLAPAVALREVFPAAPVVQELVVLAKAVREAVARTMIVQEVIVCVAAVREMLVRRDWARDVLSSRGRAGGVRERRPRSARSMCAPSKPVHFVGVTDPLCGRSCCSSSKTSHFRDAEGR